MQLCVQREQVQRSETVCTPRQDETSDKAVAGIYEARQAPLGPQSRETQRGHHMIETF